MRFSETFGIERREQDDWFDPVLSVDTKLFIDPFLIYRGERGVFVGSHQETIRFFNDVFGLIARTKGDREHPFWRRSLSLLVFREVQELCLGYSSGTTKGAGAGTGFARVIADALWEAVEAGIARLEHFEEVDLLREGIGADRISDITANLLRHRLAVYTAAVCGDRKVPCTEFRYNRGIYSSEFSRWMPLTVSLPQNPYTGRPILLVPDAYLRDLPVISADPFWDYCFNNENETLRSDYGADVSRNVDKETIVGFARRHPELRREFVRYVEATGAEPYDYEADQRGLIKWYDAAAEYCQLRPLRLNFTSASEFVSFNQSLLREFRNYVENNGGWALLWNDNGRPKSEEAAQLLFLGIVKHYCRANNVDIAPEANMGRGPVDFKVAQGYQFRALHELKLARNSKFWDGLMKQLPKYQEAEGVSIGYFIVIIESEKDLTRLTEIEAKVAEVRAATGYDVSSFTIDARRNPPSASRL